MNRQRQKSREREGGGKKGSPKKVRREIARANTVSTRETHRTRISVKKGNNSYLGSRSKPRHQRGGGGKTTFVTLGKKKTDQ